MILEGELGRQFIEAVKNHEGHNLTVCCYSHDPHNPVNYSIECEDCNEVIIDADFVRD